MPDKKQDTRLDTVKAISVFICECGPILKDAVNLDAVETYVSTLEGVSLVQRHSLLCSEDGQEWLSKKLIEKSDHHVVIAGCSPREHSVDFARVCRKAGINPSLLAIANIREQCGWVTSDKPAATEKAKIIIKAAVGRCRYHQPIEERELDCLSDIMVIGAGIAGLTASKLLAQAGRKVYLIEKEPVIGGKVPLFGEVFPTMECASCMIEPLMDEVMHHPNIELLTSCEVEDILGFYGNFTVRLKKKSRRVDEGTCCGCGSCQEACPVTVPTKDYDFGLSTRKAISIPYKGALPNVPFLDAESCLKFKQEDCDKCAKACPFGSINFDKGDEIIEKKAGAVILATGFDCQPLRKTSNDGSKRVFTLMELERLLHSEGPTKGEVKLKNGDVPHSIAMIHCASDREKAPVDFCSKVCCLSMAKCGHLIRKKLPGSIILNIVWNRSVGGKGYLEFLKENIADQNIRGLKLAYTDDLEITEDDKDGVHINVNRRSLNKKDTIAVDMAVVALPLTGSKGLASLAGKMRLDLDERGFVKVDHERLRPFNTRVEGIFVAGSAQGPKDIQESSAHGAAAAGSVLASLAPGKKLQLEPNTCHINNDRCGGCRFCLGVCPYKAITFHAEKKCAEINEVLCRGCGACAATCPSSAIVAQQFTDQQIIAEIDSSQ